MNWKRLLTDPSLWILIIVNIYFIYYYEQHPQIFTTLIWLYWSQSVLFGFFNFLAMRTATKVDISTYYPNAPKEKTDKQIAGDAAWGFLFHFGFFHLAYCIFLVSMPATGAFNWDFYKKYVLIFLIFQVINFIQQKLQNKVKAANIGKMFATPYIRVIPMHLCILIPAFFHLSNLIVFIVLKAICDIIMFITTTSYYKKDDPKAVVAVVNIDSLSSD
jgi:hypothetical protein